MRFLEFAPAGPHGSPPKGWDWPTLMRRALMVAGSDKNEVPVGALVVSPAGVILAEAANNVRCAHDPAGHAEILAIRKACARVGSERLPGHMLVVTLEPCLMCAAAICQARLAGIVFGCADMAKGAIISRLDYIDLAGSRGIWHLGGVLAPQCAAKLRKFFMAKRGE